MKSRILALLIASVAVMLQLISCETPAGNNSNTEDGSLNIPNDYVFAENTGVKFIIGSGADGSAVDSIYIALRQAAGDCEYYYTDKSELDEDDSHEVIFGKADRKASTRAYRALRQMNRANDDTARYLIYSLGNSVCIAYDEDAGGLCKDAAAKKFIELYLTGKTSLKLTSGVVYEESFSVLDYYSDIDREYYEYAFANIEETVGGEVGKEIVAAIKELYGIYNHDVVSWVANLYDPAVGGFYYSNSARNNPYYAPDTESTGDALMFINDLCMVRSWHTGESVDYSDVLSERIKNEIGVYIKSLQDADGFFYNYQWSKSSARDSRKSRDLNWCTGILSTLGLKPTYNTPNGISGDGVVVKGTYNPTILMDLPNPLGTSVVSAVSKIVLTSTYAPQFESRDTLIQYLENLYNTNGDFYSIGNTMTSQMGQIASRDKELLAEFEKDSSNAGKEYVSLASVVVDWFNSYQDPETGLWGHNAKQPSSYLGVNGLLKISGVYSSAGAEIPNAEKAAKAAIDAITSDEKMTAGVDLYNTWFSISKIISNLRTYGTVKSVDGVSMTGNERADRIMTELYSIAAPAIVKSKEKIAEFAKPDGSFSYNPQSSSSTSQGMPVAVPGTNEGDLNGTIIGSTGLVTNIFSALELPTVAIYGECDLYRLLSILEDLSPVIKEELDTLDDKPLDFDEQTVGETVSDLGGGMPEGGIRIEKDTRTGKSGNVAKIYSNSTSVGGTVASKSFAKNKSDNCYIFEADIRINNATTAGYFMQITMGSAYMFSFERSGNSIRIFESTTGSRQTARYIDLATVAVGEWFNIRVEYYKNGYQGEQRACVYINGKLVAVTDGFYGMSKTDTGYTGTPSTSAFLETQIYKMRAYVLDMDVDNIISTSRNLQYNLPQSGEGLAYNVDAGKK